MDELNLASSCMATTAFVSAVSQANSALAARRGAEYATGFHNLRRALLETVLPPFEEDWIMLMTIAIILIVLWLLGMVSAYTMGGFIHILLVIAIIVIIVRVIQGRKPI